MYQAIISKVVVRPHPNADRLQLGDVRGYQVVVGPDVKTGDLGIYFPTDGQLSEEYCTANDLIRRKDPVTGENAGGMFDANRKVRSQKFRGEPSEGYFAPLSSLAFTGTVNLKEGDLVTELNGIKICQKYESVSTRARKGERKAKKEVLTFPKHIDTPQLRFEIENIPAGSLITLIEKKHGTSARIGWVKTEKKLTGFKKWFPKIFGGTEYQVLHGSRNVVLETTDAYYKDAFRTNILEMLRPHLNKDEVLYGEIVGFTTEGTPIMSPADTSILKDKAFSEHYGKQMTFRYACEPKQSMFWLYRVVRMNEDGVGVDLSWSQVTKRAKELGVLAGPVYQRFLYDGDKDNLLKIVNEYVEGPSEIDPSHIREGVVVQVETPDGRIYWLKHKSFTFGVLEGYIKEKDVVDIEEAS